MDDESTKFRYKTFEDTCGKPIRPYTTCDCDGRRVKITPKIPAHHDSDSNIEQDPTVYYNLGAILANPDAVVPSPSNHPKAVNHSKDGEVFIYSKKGFVKELDLPSRWRYNGNETMLVIVKYQNKDKHLNPKNFTLSYRIKFD